MMSLFRNLYRIESTRCPNWDYSTPGFYYVTICTVGRLHLFGQVVNGEMVLNEYGNIADFAWRDLPNHYPHVVLDKYVIMPNHVHGVIQLLHDRDVHAGSVASTWAGASAAGSGDVADDDPDFDPDCDDGGWGVGGSVETGLKPVSTDPPKPYRRHGLSEIIRAFNTFSARRVNVVRGTPGMRVWQPRFHDRIVRDEQELFRIRRYIMNNPRNWHKDRLHRDSDSTPW